MRGSVLVAAVCCGAAGGCASSGRMDHGKGAEGAMVTSFMAGTWVGAAEGSYAEEHWGPEHGGRMIGCYRESGPGGETRMFELMEIDASGGGPTTPARLRIRHFDGAMTPWKNEAAPLTLVLAESGAGRAVFRPEGPSALSGIEYVRNGEELTATVTFAPERGRGPIVVRMRRSGAP